MTVDDLLALAERVKARDYPERRVHLEKIAAGVLELLSTEATPCGFDEPTPDSDPHSVARLVRIPAQYGRAALETDEARWFATSILRACGGS